MDAAAAAGVCEKTIRRWKKLPHFKRALDEATEAAFDALEVRIQSTGDAAIDALIKNLKGRNLQARSTRPLAL